MTPTVSCFNIWSSVDKTVWKALGSVVMLKEGAILGAIFDD